MEGLNIGGNEEENGENEDFGENEEEENYGKSSTNLVVCPRFCKGHISTKKIW